MARKKKTQYPTKTTVNLVIRERSINSPRTLLPLFLLVLVAIGAFSKFAVIDRLAEVGAARTELNAAQATLTDAQNANADYAAVLEEYSRFSESGLSEEERAAVDRKEVLDLLDGQLMPFGQVSSVSLKDNTMTVILSGITLQGLSDLIPQLKDSEIISDVQVYTAGATMGQDGESIVSDITMSILLTQPGEGGDAS